MIGRLVVFLMVESSTFYGGSNRFRFIRHFTLHTAEKRVL